MDEKKYKIIKWISIIVGFLVGFVGSQLVMYLLTK